MGTLTSDKPFGSFWLNENSFSNLDFQGSIYDYSESQLT